MLVVHIHGGFQFLLGFLLVSQVEQQLSPHVMDVGAGGIELDCGIDLE